MFHVKHPFPLPVRRIIPERAIPGARRAAEGARNGKFSPNSESSTRPGGRCGAPEGKRLPATWSYSGRDAQPRSGYRLKAPNSVKTCHRGPSGMRAGDATASYIERMSHVKHPFRRFRESGGGGRAGRATRTAGLRHGVPARPCSPLPRPAMHPAAPVGHALRRPDRPRAPPPRPAMRLAAPVGQCGGIVNLGELLLLTSASYRRLTIVSEAEEIELADTSSFC